MTDPTLAATMPPSTEAVVEVIRESDADGVRTLVMSSPPVNTISRPMRIALFNALARAEADPNVRGVILRGAGAGFSGGADIEEFDSTDALAEPSLHRTIAAAVEAMTTPVVAAMHGFALGGGLELALICHARVAAAGTRIGLPEITLGFIPGAGGTQRLVRAMPLERAVSHLLLGDSFPVESEPEGCLVDEIVGEGELEDAARRVVDRLQAIRPLPRLRDVRLDAASYEIALSAAEQLLERKRLLSPAGVSILDAVRVGLSDIDAGLHAEFGAFQALAGTSAARASRYRFKALRAVRRRPKIAYEVRSAAVIGAGTMGRGIAAMLAAAGIHVAIVDTDTTALEAAAAQVRETAPGGVQTYTRIRDLPTVDLVVEAVIEDLEVKRQVFAELSAHLPEDSVLATNTSSLDIDRIAAAATHPERVLGLHFFSPVAKMPLVEVVAGRQTDPTIVDRCRALLLSVGKTPVVVGNAPSFVGNRIFDRYLQEAHMLHLEGAPVAEVDAAAMAIGMPAGPFRVLDGIGNDVPHRGREQRGTADAPEWSVARALVEAGRLGRKSGVGWYSYRAQEPEDTFVEDAADRAREALGLRKQAFLPMQIQERLRMALIAEALAVVSEGIAQTASDVDVIMTLGYGFPADQGGPVFLARQLGDGLVEAALERLAAQPEGFPGARWMTNGVRSGEEKAA